MNQLKSTSGRRNFIKNTAAAAAAITLGLAGPGALAARRSHSFDEPFTGSATGFDQKTLPYAYNALEDVIDAMTMEIHYSKHASTYAKNLKDAAAAEGIDTSKPLEDVLAKVSKYSAKLRNNAGGHYNHEMFWQSMRPKTANNKPSGKLLQSIESTFTSFASFKEKFNEAGKNRFGSGWAWLYLDAGKTLKIGSTPNQDNPLMDVSEIKGIPLLGLDVWEHAYYLKYQNKRADYIENWWNVVNWENVQQRFEKI